MKRLLSALLLLGAGALIGGVVSVLAQDPTPARMTIRQWDAAGNITDWECVALPAIATPTPEGATPPPVESATPTVKPSPTSTPTVTPTPTASNTPLPLCQGVTTSALNFRAGPGTSFAVLKDLTQTVPPPIVFPLGQLLPIHGWTQTDGALWLKTVYKAQSGWVSGLYVTLNAACAQEFPTMPTATKTAWGVWAGPGASRDELVSFGRTLKAKGITPAATVYGDAATASLLTSEGWVVAWRAYTGLNCPVFTEPPEQNAAQWWTDTLAASQGVSFTWLVVCNEPVFPTVNYAVRWILTIVDLTERDHVARVVPVVWSPGRPALEEVPALALALHSDVISTCWGANLYPAKTGVGLDVFDEWTTYRLLKYPADLPLCVTEFAAGEGGDVPNFAQYPAFVQRYDGRLLWATAWYDAMPLGIWPNANLRGKLAELASALF